MRRGLTLLLALVLALTSMASVAAQNGQATGPAEPIEVCDYFDATGHNLCEPFLGFWNSNGGLPVFGYPITEAFDELSQDTGDVYSVQYFERERLEHHPALAGTAYEVLLGRLGNEVLLAQGRDWLEFEKDDPAEDNYFDVTGFAVPQVFMDFWQSHGLDLGNTGTSFRESLALFGYPISPAAMETNASGHTVLTQWFERARFEHHPDNAAEHQVLIGLLGSELLSDDPVDPGTSVELTFITGEVSQPRHISKGADGALYVANAGMGGDTCIEVPLADGETGTACLGNSGSITRIANGEAEIFINGIPSLVVDGESIGLHNVVVTESGTVYGVMGFGLGLTPEVRSEMGDGATYFGHLVEIAADGSLSSIADILAYEAAEDQDGNGIDANPYALVLDGDTFLVADAGMNALLRISLDGEISTVVVFPAQVVPAPPFIPAPEIPSESVPTHIVAGPDGNFYVGELTGFPFHPGSARVWMVAPDGEASVHATGFTNIGALAFDSDGNLLVLEIIAGGLLAVDPENPQTTAGRLVRVAADGSHELIAGGAEGIAFSTGMAIDDNGDIHIANLAVIPGAGHIARVDIID